MATGTNTGLSQTGTVKILVVQTAFLGDLLLATPLFKNIRRIFPNCEITLVCRKGFGELFIKLNLVQKLAEIEKKNQQSYQRVVADLNAEDFDYIFSPHESMTTALMVRKIHGKKKIGYKRWWNFIFFDQRIKKDYAFPDSLRQISLLSELDSEIPAKLAEFKLQAKNWKSDQGQLCPVPDWASAVVNLESIKHEQKFLISENKKYVVFFPGSVWKTKQWKEEGFTESIKYFHKNGFVIVLLGTKQERELCDRVSAGLDRVKNLAGQTSLMQSLAVISGAALVIANDSAGQHLAALAGVRTVTIFGPTVQKLGYRSWNSKAIIVEKNGLTCRPCGKHGHHKCPIGTHECMKLVTSAMVIEASEYLLKKEYK